MKVPELASPAAIRRVGYAEFGHTAPGLCNCLIHARFEKFILESEVFTSAAFLELEWTRSKEQWSVCN